MANVLPTMGASDRNPRKIVGTHYTTPVGSMLDDKSAHDNMEAADRQGNEMIDGSLIQAQRTKKLQFVAAELKRLRYF